MHHVLGTISVMACVAVAILLHKSARSEWEQAACEKPGGSRVPFLMIVARLLCVLGLCTAWYGASTYVEFLYPQYGVVGVSVAMLCIYAIWLAGWRAGWSHERRERKTPDGG